MLKRLLPIVGWLIFGLIGSAAIFITTVIIADRSVPARLPSLHIFTTMWDDLVSATGTWVMDNERQAYPLQTSKIICNRTSMECTEAQADLHFGMLTPYRETYQITRWDAAFLSFRVSKPCVDYAYTIDRENKRIIGTRTKTANSTGLLCDAVTPGPIQLSLTDGLVVWKRLQADAWAEVSPFMWVALGVL